MYSLSPMTKHRFRGKSWAQDRLLDLLAGLGVALVVLGATGVGLPWPEAVQRAFSAVAGMAAVSLALITARRLVLTPHTTTSQGTPLQVTVRSEMDVDVFIDGRKALTVDHNTGYAYATGRAAVNPGSEITFVARGWRITRRAGEFRPPTGARGFELQIGTRQSDDVTVSPEQYRRSMGKRSEVRKLAKTLQTAENSAARAWTAERLGVIGGDTARDALVSALQDRDDYVRARTAYALGELGDVKAYDAVVEAYAAYAAKASYGYLFEYALRKLAPEGPDDAAENTSEGA